MRIKPKNIIAVAVVLIIVGAGTIVNQMGPVDKKDKTGVVVEVPTGSSTSKIAKILSEKNLIKNESLFKMVAKFSSDGSKVKAGTYKIDKSFSNKDILKLMAAGKIYNVGTKIVVPEGAIYREIVDNLVNNKLGDKAKFESLIKDPKQFASKYEFLKDSKITTLEGFLYPATYHFEAGKVSEEQIIDTMLAKFNTEYIAKIKPILKPDQNLKDIITMGSIVEEEAVKDEDRPIIASVFYNRLKNGTPLQSDAIIEYSFTDRKKIVTYNDLKIDSPYNSYRNKGLPPTPIANPGIKSIEAAINPAKTDYLFFVTQMNGENSFSKTYDEHLKAVKKFKEDRAKIEAEKNQ
ncbi:MAG: endolytic transglycosylase MltG [Clostridioides sp.]|jgi:UPF0755 protein|nr:endolytic transglycosylase MltG [Clostridioides sp.]